MKKAVKIVKFKFIVGDMAYMLHLGNIIKRRVEMITYTDLGDGKPKTSYKINLSDDIFDYVDDKDLYVTKKAVAVRWLKDNNLGDTVQ